MQLLRQILLFVKRGYSEREIARQTKVSRPTVHLYATLFKATGRAYDELLSLKDTELKALIDESKPDKTETEDPRKAHFLDQLPYFIGELGRVGVTRYLLWKEYLELFPGGFQYSRFCELLDIEMTLRKPAMHLQHNPGELLEIDFAGSKLHYVNDDGEVIECPVLVAVLPFSGYSFVQALPNASLPRVIDALNAILEYFQGVPMNVISDNMRQWVSKTCRYEPTFPEMLQEWALHNQIGLLATRPGRPKDKPSVENNVLITYRRVFALLRNDTFRSLEALNQAILTKLDLHHRQNFQKKSYSRQELFNTEERPLLHSLPETPYQVRHYTRAKVQKNYHVVLGEDWHFYSVPFSYLGKEVSLAYCSEHVEIYHELNRIAIHTRSFKKHGYSTQIDHMPENHRKISERRGWNPDYYLNKAQENGPSTYEFFTQIMENKVTIHQAYGPCLGILRLIDSFGGPRVEAACKRALRGKKCNYGVIKTILENNMDLHEEAPVNYSPIPVHSNLRGPEAYSNLN